MRMSVARGPCVFFAVLLVAVAPLPAMAAVIYVDSEAMGANDGTSWGDAYVDLQTALGTAVSPYSVWVAAGTYYPSSVGDRDSAFQLMDDVSIYGGFAGNETSLSERDWVLNPTILSGDIGVQGDDTDNSYHVVVGSGTGPAAVLDGFTVTLGRAEHPDPEDPRSRGGGMYISGGGPTLRNLVFTDNSARAYGGGMCNEAGSEPKLTSVTFSGNSAVYGGGVHDSDSDPMLFNVVFFGNSASGPGGGMSNFEGSEPTLTNVTFSGNTAGYGGGMLNNYSSPTLVNTILWGDSADYVGNEMYNDMCSPTASYCLIQGGLPSNCLDGGNNTYSNPLFVDGPDGDLRLANPQSAAFDAGDNSAPGLPATDRDGNPRVMHDIVDIGAYELQLEIVTGVGEPAPFSIVSFSPNPFTEGATMTLALPTPELVTVRVYDPAGRLVRTLAEERMPAGEHGVVWDGRDGLGRSVASGVYFVRAQAGRLSGSMKVVLLR